MGSSCRATSMQTLVCIALLLGHLSWGKPFDIGSIIQVLLGPEPAPTILEDYPSCGELGNRTVRRSEDYNKQDNSCFQTCVWQTNPYYKTSIPWDLFKRNTENTCIDIEKTINVLITAPNVPKKLSCLKKCFDDVNFYDPRQPCDPDRAAAAAAKCNSTLTVVDFKMDCIMRAAIKPDLESQDIQTNLPNEDSDVLIQGSPTENVNSPSDDEEILWARNSLQLALEICALAKMCGKLNGDDCTLFKNEI